VNEWGPEGNRVALRFRADPSLARWRREWERARRIRELNIKYCQVEQKPEDLAAGTVAAESPAEGTSGQDTVKANEAVAQESAAESAAKEPKEAGKQEVPADKEVEEKKKAGGDAGTKGDAEAGAEPAGGKGTEEKVEKEGEKKESGGKEASTTGGLGVKQTATFKSPRGGRGGGPRGGSRGGARGAMNTGGKRPLPKGGVNPVAMMAQMTTNMMQQNVQKMMAAAANTPQGRAALMAVAMGGAVPVRCWVLHYGQICENDYYLCAIMISHHMILTACIYITWDAASRLLHV